jgi:L-2-hydroxycarboxylate dehydrogenase (NAD+)
VSADTTEPAHTVEVKRLRDFITALFAAAGLRDEDAGQVAYALVRANLRGVKTHGVFRTPTYLKRLRQGLNNPRPNIAVKQVALNEEAARSGMPSLEQSRTA